MENYVFSDQFFIRYACVYEKQLGRFRKSASQLIKQARNEPKTDLSCLTFLRQFIKIKPSNLVQLLYLTRFYDTFRLLHYSPNSILN